MCARSVVTDSDAPTTLREQLQLFAQHGVFVCAMGAGLANVMFFPQYSSVIEIFPPLVDHNIGPTLSVFSGLGYYPIHAQNTTRIVMRKVRKCAVGCSSDRSRDWCCCHSWWCGRWCLKLRLAVTGVCVCVAVLTVVTGHDGRGLHEPEQPGQWEKSTLQLCTYSRVSD